MQSPNPNDPAALKRQFQDFDREDVYKRACEAALDPESKNFVVLFGSEKAKIALDLEPGYFEHLWNWTEPDYPIRWINLWGTSSLEQTQTIRHVAHRFGFSRRLIASITHWDKYRDIIKQHAEAKKQHAKRQQTEEQSRDAGNEKDPEQGLNGHAEAQTMPKISEGEMEELANFSLVQSSFNYNAVDHDKKFTCIGANWLHTRPTEDGFSDNRLVPPKHWSWLALCANVKSPDTVISINEKPNYEPVPDGVRNPAAWKSAEMKSMRLNTLTVLKQISDIGLKDYYENKALSVKAIRVSKSRLAHSIGDAPTTYSQDEIAEVFSSNLFYYLFEDTAAVVPILGDAKFTLDDLTARILNSAHKKEKVTESAEIIPKLHKLGQDLRLLQHLFESYKTLIHTILAPSTDHDAFQRLNADQQTTTMFARIENELSLMRLAQQAITGSGSADTETSQHPQPEHRASIFLSGQDVDMVSRIQLKQQARDRFKRLGDRLQLLLLNTIKNYLDEKSELSSTYFNLTAQKDSQATARLTRSATLLAKLSVFFLPISFMTSYFSVQIPDLTNNYTGQTYWGAFGVVATLSFISLFFFGRLLMFISERLDGMTEGVEKWFFDRRRTSREKKKDVTST